MANSEHRDLMSSNVGLCRTCEPQQTLVSTAVPAWATAAKARSWTASHTHVATLLGGFDHD
jgi:hypothetical protein